MAYKEYAGEVLPLEPAVQEYTGEVIPFEPAAAPEKPGLISGAVDAIGTGMNAYRDFWTKTAPKQESVLQNVKMQEQPFDPAEANRMSNRKYAEQQQDAFKPQPQSIGPTTSTAKPILSNILDATLEDRAGRGSVGGLVLESAGDAARGMIMGVEGMSSGAWDALGMAAEQVGGLGSFGKLARSAGAAGREASDSWGNKQDPQSVVQGVFQSITQQMVTAGLTGGFGNASIALQAGISGANAYGEARDAGKDENDSLERAALNTFAEFIGEKVALPGLQKVMKGFGTGGTVKEFGKTMAEWTGKELGGEEFTTTLENLYEKFGSGGLRPDMTIQDQVDDMVQTFKVTLGQSLLMGGAGAAVNKLHQVSNTPAKALARELDSRDFDPAATAIQATQAFQGRSVDGDVHPLSTVVPQATAPVPAPVAAAPAKTPENIATSITSATTLDGALAAAKTAVDTSTASIEVIAPPAVLEATNKPEALPVLPESQNGTSPVISPAPATTAGAVGTVANTGVESGSTDGLRPAVTEGTVNPNVLAQPAELSGAVHDTPVAFWKSPNKQGYATQEEAAKQIAGRQIADQQQGRSLDWRVEPMQGGRFLLAGYESTKEVSNAQAAQAVQTTQERSQASTTQGVANEPTQMPNGIPDGARAAGVQAGSSQVAASGLPAVAQQSLPQTVGSENPTAAAARTEAQVVVDRAHAANPLANPKITLAAPAPEASQQIHAALEQTKSLFGVSPDIVPFSDPAKDSVNGFVRQTTGQTFINTSGLTTNVVNTAWHEVHHVAQALAEVDTQQGKTDTPAQKYVASTNSIFDTMSESGKLNYIANFLYHNEVEANPAVKSYRDSLPQEDRRSDPKLQELRLQAAKSFLSQPDLRKEMVADFVGNRATDKQFLKMMARVDGGGFANWVKNWIATINNLLVDLRGSGNKESAAVDRYVADLKKSRAVFMNALLEFRKGGAQNISTGTQQQLSFQQRQRLTDSSFDGRRFVPVDEIQAGPLSDEKKESLKRELAYEDERDRLGNNEFDADSITNSEYKEALAEKQAAPDSQTQEQLLAELNDLQREERNIARANRADRIAQRVATVSTVATPEQMKVHGLFPERAFDFGVMEVGENIQGREEISFPNSDPSLGRVVISASERGGYNVKRINDWFMSDQKFTKDVALTLAKAHAVRATVFDSGYDLTNAYKKGTLLRLVAGWKELAKAKGVFKNEGKSTGTNFVQIAKDMGAFPGYTVGSYGSIRALHINLKDKTTGVEYEAHTHSSPFSRDDGFAINTINMEGSKAGSDVYAVVAQYAKNMGERFYCDTYISSVNTFRRTEQAFSFALKTGDSGVLFPGKQNRVYGFNENPKTEIDHAMNIARLALANMRNVMEVLPDTTTRENGSHVVKYDAQTGAFTDEYNNPTMIGLTRLSYNPETAVFSDQSGRDVTKGVKNWLSAKENRGTGIGESTLARAVITNNIIMGKLDVNVIETFMKPVAYQRKQGDVFKVENAEGDVEKSKPYTPEHKAAALVEKFDRMDRFHKDRDSLLATINKDAKAGVQEAIVLRLIAHTGLRIGNPLSDTHGATTLLPEHVKINGNTVSFDFIGKSGVRQRHSIINGPIARDLEKRMGKTPLFNVSDRAVRRYKDLIARDYKVHDFRTWIATDAAQQVVNDLPLPMNRAEYFGGFELALSVAATKIGDTIGVTSEHYINPAVFDPWRKSAGIEDAPRVQKGAVASEDSGKQTSVPGEKQSPDGQAVREVDYSKKGVVGEVAPHPDRAEDWDKLPNSQKENASRDIARKMFQSLVDQHGLKGWNIEFSTGQYQGKTNPNFIVSAPENATDKQVERMARDIGYVLDQQSMVMFDDSNDTGENQASFVKVILPEGFPKEKLQELRDLVHERFPRADANTLLTQQELVFGNFTQFNGEAALSDEEFRGGIMDAVRVLPWEGDAFRIAQTERYESRLIWPDRRSDYLKEGVYGEDNRIQARPEDSRAVLRSEQRGNLLGLRAIAREAIRERKQAEGAGAENAQVASFSKKEISDWADVVKKGEKTDPYKVLAESPSAQLRMAGLSTGDKIIVDQGFVRHIEKNDRDVPSSVIGSLPSLVMSPRAVLVTYEKTEPVTGKVVDVKYAEEDGYKKRINVISSAVDGDGNPYLIGIRPTPLGARVTNLATMFGRKNSLAYVMRSIMKGGFVWTSDKEIARLRDITGGTTLASPEGISRPNPVKGAEVMPPPNQAESIVYGNAALGKMLSGGDWKAAGVPITVTDADIQSASGANFSRKQSLLTGQALPELWQAPDTSRMDDFIYSVQDKHIDTKRVTKAVRDAILTLDERQDPYLQEELFHGRASYEVKSFLEKQVRPLLIDMQSRGVKMEDLEEYLHNRHAERRNIQVAKVNLDMPDGGSGIDTADARAYLSGLSVQDARNFKALAARVDQINKDTRNLLVSSGLEKQSTIDAWQAAYGDEYVPLMREEMDNGMGIGQGFSVRGGSSKRAMGSSKPVANILANIMLAREKAITRSEKRKVGEALYGMVLEAPNPNFWFAIDPALAQNPKQLLATSMQLIDMGLNPADAEAIAKEPTQRYINPTTGMVAERINPALRGAENVLAVRIDGEDKFVFFNAQDERAMRMVRALKNLDSDQLGKVMGTVAKMTRYFSSINTQYNPVFGLTNIARDVQDAMLNLKATELKGKQKEVMSHILPALRGIYIDLRDHRAGKTPTSAYAKIFEEFQQQGGATGFRDMYAHAEDRANAIKDEIDGINAGRLKQTGQAIFGWLSDYNEAMENAVRVSAYKVGIESGMSQQKAASLAKNLTVNFNRKGQVALQAGALYAFFNAAVQGTARTTRTMFTDGKLSRAGKQILTGGLLLGSMQALLLAGAGFGDDEPPEFLREKNLIIPIGGKKYVSIPMPLGYHVIPNLSRITTEWAMSGFKNTPKRIADLIGLLSDAFNPIGSAGLSIQTLTPTIIDPLAALSENRDWTGKPIAKEDFNQLKPTAGHTRAKNTATPWSKAISYGVNMLTGGTDYKPGIVSPTPDQIDYVIGQVTGGVGREVGKLAQVGSSAITGEELPLYKVPVVGRFVGTTEGQAAEAGKYYDNLKEIGSHQVEIEGLTKDHKGFEAAQYRRENPAAKLIDFAHSIESDVTKLNKEKRDLIKKGSSAERVKMIEAQITRKMKTLNDRTSQAGQ